MMRRKEIREESGIEEREKEGMERRKPKSTYQAQEGGNQTLRRSK